MVIFGKRLKKHNIIRNNFKKDTFYDKIRIFTKILINNFSNVKICQKESL
jgi:hypothetical protein